MTDLLAFIRRLLTSWQQPEWPVDFKNPLPWTTLEKRLVGISITNCTRLRR